MEAEMAELRFTTENRTGVVIAAFEGSIHMGGGDVVLKESVRKLIDEGMKKVVLDLSRVTAIDSVGIGQLVGLAVSARRQGGEIRLAALTKKIRDLMEIVRLNTVFSCHDSVDDAVRAFRG